MLPSSLQGRCQRRGSITGGRGGNTNRTQQGKSAAQHDLKWQRLNVGHVPDCKILLSIIIHRKFRHFLVRNCTIVILPGTRTGNVWLIIQTRFLPVLPKWTVTFYLLRLAVFPFLPANPHDKLTHLLLQECNPSITSKTSPSHNWTPCTEEIFHLLVVQKLLLFFGAITLNRHKLKEGQLQASAPMIFCGMHLHQTVICCN